MKKTIITILAALLLLTAFACQSADSQQAEEAGTEGWKTMADALNATTGSSQYAYDAEHFVYAFESNETPYRVACDFSVELYEQLDAIDFFDEEREAKIAAILGPLPLTLTEDLSSYQIPQSELDTWIGKTGQDMLDAGFGQAGYFYDEQYLEYTLEKGLFYYTVTFSEPVSEEQDWDEVIKSMTVKSIKVDGMSGYVTDWPLVY